jgi:uncharacterized repeat protein (TIGR01451 family)
MQNPDTQVRLAELESELAEKNATISSLRGNMTSLQSRVSEYESNTKGGQGNLHYSIESPATSYPGQTIPYRIRIQNISEEPVLQIEVICHLENGLEPVETGGGSFDTATSSIRWRLSSLSPKAKEILNFTAKSTEVGSYVCSVDVRHRIASPNVRILRPVIACNIEGPSVKGADSDFNLTVNVKNSGTGVATDVRGVIKSFRGISIRGGNPDAVIDFGDIPADATVTRTLQVHGEDEGKFELILMITGQPNLEDTASFSGELVSPKLEITQKPIQRVRYLGQEVEYEITVKSIGSDTAKEVLLINSLPSGADFIESTPEGKMEAGKVIWDLGSLEPGRSAKIRLRARADRQGSLVNRTSVAAKGIDAQESTSEVEVIGVVGMMMDCVDTVDPVEVGKETTYVVRIRNQSTATEATHVVIRAELPEQCKYISAESSTGAKHVYDKSKHEVSFSPVAVVKPGHDHTFRILVSFVQNGDAVFSASMHYQEFGKPIRNEEGTYVYGK